jgi:hypothetical protein
MNEAPSTAILNMINGFRISQLVFVVAQLGVADLLADGPQAVETLAATTHAQPEQLFRVMRALATQGVFVESAGRRFALTPLSDCLRTTQPGSLRSRAIFAGSEVYRAYGDLLYSVQTGGAAFDHVFGMSHFAYLAQHPEASAIFNQEMTLGSVQDASAVVEAYDFNEARVVVDVAGGQGVLLSTILQAHPALHGVLFDQPHVVASAEPFLRSAGVADRCEVASGDFFVGVPTGGDVYTLRQIIHDWDDDRAVAILRSCAQAMAPDGRVALIELVMNPSDTAAQGVYLDITMMVMNGGHERTAAEYDRLFNAAGLRLTRIIPTASVSSVIEGVRA